MSDDPILQQLAEKRAEELREKISRKLKLVANSIERDLRSIKVPGYEGEKPVFGLFVFTAGAAQYIGNGTREDIKRVVGSVISRWDDPAYEALHKAWHEKTDEEKTVEKDNPL